MSSACAGGATAALPTRLEAVERGEAALLVEVRVQRRDLQPQLIQHVPQQVRPLRLTPGGAPPFLAGPMAAAPLGMTAVSGEAPLNCPGRQAADASVGSDTFCLVKIS